jgi:hypothetical protein
MLGLDIDVKDGGGVCWKLLEETQGSVDAPTLRTAGGGLHLHFSHRKSLARATYMQAPPSRNICRRRRNVWQAHRNGLAALTGRLCGG